MITAPRPGDQNGLYQLAPVLPSGGRWSARASRSPRSSATSRAQATVAGINGDFSPTAAGPAGIADAAVLLRPPLQSPLLDRHRRSRRAPRRPRQVRRRLAGTGPAPAARRPQPDARCPARSSSSRPPTALRCRASRARPRWCSQPFPAAAAEHRSRPRPSPRSAPAAASRSRRRRGPAGDRRSAAAKLQAEAPVGTPRDRAADPAADLGRASSRRSAAGRCSCGTARRSSARARTSRATRSPSARREPASASSPTAGSSSSPSTATQPGYSAGMTSFELAQTMQRLGAVTCVGASRPGGAVTAGVRRPPAQPPERPRARERPSRGAARRVLRRLRAAVAGPAAERRSGAPGRAALVQARAAVDRDRRADRPRRRAACARERRRRIRPGVYPLTFAAYDAEGAWHWHVAGTDDLGRTLDRRPLVPLRRDASRAGVAAGRRGSAASGSRWHAPRRCACGSRRGAASSCATSRPRPLTRGAQQLTWDGGLPQGTRAYAGAVRRARLRASAVGASELSVPFTFRR